MAATVDAHKTFSGIVKRLRRAEGHLRSIVGMIDDGRPCLELAQQLHAVEKAIAEAKRTLIHDHIDHCLANAARPGKRDDRTSIEEFKLITKFL